MKRVKHTHCSALFFFPGALELFGHINLVMLHFGGEIAHPGAH